MKVKFYINEQEVNKRDFERQYPCFDINWIIDTMILNEIKCYNMKSPYNKKLKILII